MNLLHVFVLITVVLSLLFSLFMARRWNTKIQQNHGMIISMFSGSSIGLALGGVLAITYKGDLFISTILGIILGGICSLLFCWNLGIVHMLGGLSAGVMGGMMGAMIIDMLPMVEDYIMLKIFLVLLVCSLFLYPIFAEAEEKTSTLWLVKPLIILVIILFFFIGGSSLIEERVVLLNDRETHH